uniref:Uncharacterized protein n=1 Tax=Glossina austeni TaxID=7395 RepID=A0A1A9VFQ7_GLOAU
MKVQILLRTGQVNCNDNAKSINNAYVNVTANANADANTGAGDEAKGNGKRNAYVNAGDVNNKAMLMPKGLWPTNANVNKNAVTVRIMLIAALRQYPNLKMGDANANARPNVNIMDIQVNDKIITLLLLMLMMCKAEDDSLPSWAFFANYYKCDEKKRQITIIVRSTEVELWERIQEDRGVT